VNNKKKIYQKALNIHKRYSGKVHVMFMQHCSLRIRALKSKANIITNARSQQ
jgi:hypothetical protein